jgi:hypothetical protein
MFLVKDQRYETTYLVFTWEDPRENGFRGDVVEGVSLDYNMEAVHRWQDGRPCPEVCVGRAKNDPKHYQVFRYSSDREAAGYEQVPGMPLVFGSWSDYIRVRLNPPDPEQTDDEHWYGYLDKLDEDSRRRRRSHPELPGPTSGNRDEVAAWLAKTHIVADSGIQEVWYLPTGAPPDEIRLLEVNDRLAGSQASVEAVDFGLEVGGTSFRLSVADITTEQLLRIREDPSRLPPGWSIEGASTWGRRAA